MWPFKTGTQHQDEPVPDGDWAALARAVLGRRFELGIPDPAAAAAQVRLATAEWERLEAGMPVSDRTVALAGRVLRWVRGEAWAILDGEQPAAGPESARLPVDRPALVYIGTDGAVTRLDRADLDILARIDGRERALCAALLDHARARLDQAGISVASDDHPSEGHAPC